MDRVLRALQLVVLAFLGAAGLLAWRGHGVDLARPLPWVATGAVLVVLELARAGWRRLTAFPADEYGPRTDDLERFERHVVRIGKIDRNLARRWRVQKRLRARIGRALAADRIERAERHLEAAAAVLEDWGSLRAPRRERKALLARYERDRNEVHTRKYENAARAQLARAERLKTARGREAARARAAGILRRGFADPEADGARLALLAEETGLDRRRSGVAPPPPDGSRAAPRGSKGAGAAPPHRSASDREHGRADPDRASRARRDETADATAAPARWVPIGERAEVRGRMLAGGFWLGGRLRGPDGARDHALVDPELPIARTSAPPRTQRPPDYAGMAAQGRTAFLEWMAGGRRAADPPRAFVLQFLHGLERRALIDAEGGGAARVEVPALRGEVLRLADLCTADRATRTQLLAFEDYLALRFPSAPERAGRAAPPALAESPPVDLPASVRLALAAHARAGRPLSAAWARAWLHLATCGKLRTAAQRCRPEFEELFVLRYRERYGAGLVPRPAATRLRASYRPSNPAWRERTFTAELDYCEADPGPVLGELRALADECAAELGALSRHSARAPDRPPGLATLATLPAALLANREEPGLLALRALLLRATRGGRLQSEELLALFGEHHERPSRAVCTRCAQLAAKLSYGLEPDPRFDGAAWRSGQSLVVFELGAAAPHAPSSGYAAAAAAASLSVAIAAADGPVTDGAGTRETGTDGAGPDGVARARVEESLLARHLERTLELTVDERARLTAHLTWVRENPPPAASLRRRVARLSAAARSRLARFLAQVACADGAVSPAEVAFLESAYALLGREPGEVHADLHALTSGAPAASGAAPGSAPRPAEAGAVALDPELLRAKQAETRAVAGLLREVFASDEAEEAEEAGDAQLAGAAADPGQEARTYHGLDAAHSALLEALGERDVWTRAEVEDLCATLELLPDGALDTLNDTAFQELGDPLWEGDDPIEVDRAVADELCA